MAPDPKPDPQVEPSARASGAEPAAHDEAHLDRLVAQFHEGEHAAPDSPATGAGQAGSGSEGAGAAATSSGPARDEDEGEDDEDGFDRVALRATHLGRRLARRRGHALTAREKKPTRLFGSWALFALSLLGAWGLASALPDLRYWLSSAPPLDLGRMGAYRLDGVADGAYVKVEGIASPRRGSWSRLMTEHELFPLIGSRILVDRRRAPDPGMKGFGFKYAGEGRLSMVTDESRWAGVREQFAVAGEVSKEGLVVVLEDGVVPRRGLRVPLEAAAWTALIAVSFAVLVRRARSLRPR